MRHILENFKPYRRIVVILICLLAVQAWCDLSLPGYTQDIIDIGIQNKGIEHILPEKIPADEYESAQIFMTDSEKELWTSSYKADSPGEKGRNYVRNSLTDDELEKLDEKLLTPIVLTYQLGHTSESDFKKMMEGIMSGTAAGSGSGADSDTGPGSAAGTGSANAGTGPGSETDTGSGSGNGSVTGKGPGTDSASGSVPDSAAPYSGMFRSEIRTFEAEDEDGNKTTYIDMRPVMAELISSGLIDSKELDNAKKETEKVLKQVGDSTLKAMAVRYAIECDEKAGVDTVKIQKTYLWTCGGKMALMAALLVLAASCVSFLAARVGAAIGRDLRGKIFSKVMSFSNAETEKFSTSSLITRCTNDVQQVQMVSTMSLRMVLYAPVIGLWGVINVARTGAHMSWVIFLGVSMVIGIIMLLMAIANPKFRIMQKLVDNLNSVSREILTGLQVVRAFGREKTEEERFDKANQELRRTQLFTNRVMTFMSPSIDMVMYTVIVLITWIAAKRIDSGTLQVGAMTAFITYTMIVITSFMVVTAMSIMLPRAAIAADRIHEVLTTESSIKEKEDPADLPEGRGTVTYEHVNFKYPGAEHNVITDIDFTARPGEVTAIIGGTGSGKSTLVNLLPRFYDVTGGSVKIDGVDVRDLRLHDLRQAIGFVPQNGVLFTGTVDSNIRFGNEEASEELVREAAATAQASEFIDAGDDGYDRFISQGGSNVSGGQRQRLAIARALAKEPKILVFDDSFSALDMKTDAKLRRALEEKEKDTVKIIVAQRVSTILNAEQILVLDEGRIVGKGTHKELMNTCGLYRQIAESQLSQRDLEVLV